MLTINSLQTQCPVSGLKIDAYLFWSQACPLHIQKHTLFRLKLMIWRGKVDIEMKEGIKGSIDRVMGAIEDMFRHFPPH